MIDTMTDYITDYYRDRRGDNQIPYHAGPDTDFIKQKGLRFLTNFDAREYDLYIQTIQMYWSETADMDTIFFISRYASDSYGNTVNAYYSLWSNIRTNTDMWKNTKNFWNLWQKMKAVASNNVFIEKNEFSL